MFCQRNSAPWAKELPITDIAFEPVSSNRSLCCRETEFSGRRQRGQNGFEKARDTVAETTSR